MHLADRINCWDRFGLDPPASPQLLSPRPAPDAVVTFTQWRFRCHQLPTFTPSSSSPSHARSGRVSYFTIRRYRRRQPPLPRPKIQPGSGTTRPRPASTHAAPTATGTAAATRTMTTTSRLAVAQAAGAAPAGRRRAA